MKKSEHLKFMLERNKAAFNALLKDVDEDDSLHRMAGYPNHIRWEVGHMARGLSQVLASLTDQGDFPDDWGKLFVRGAVLSEDPSVYPSLGQIKLKADQLFDRLFDVLGEMSDEQLEEEVEILPGWKTARMHGAAFLCMHDYYHCGQIAVLRSALGKERQFG